MADERNMRETDLVLPYGVYAYVLEINKGNVNVLCGPFNQTLSAQSMQPVVYDPVAGRFTNSDKDRAIRNNIKANKGQYVILRNPSSKNAPKSGASSTLDPDDLQIGQTENIPGPFFRALWPGQEAEVVDGHQLRTNQYLVVRVVDDETAEANWDKAILRTASDDGLKVDATKLYIGQLIIVRGSDVSFYIPPTGVEVLKDKESGFVRDAVTLEALEYCILLGEDGNKRYMLGPDVVFPEPTEKFISSSEGKVKFQAYELNELSGIHIKVIAEYEEKDGETIIKRMAGDELFITGKDQPLYMPRTEHAIIKYDGRTRYHAVAIPKGEARYVLERMTGNIKTVYGPAMLLLDPRTEVFTRKILSQKECELYYPTNQEVEQVNAALRQIHIPEAFVGIASAAPAADSAALYGSTGYRTPHLSSSILSTRGLSGASMTASDSQHADVLNRGDKFTPPRELILDTKYAGAVRIMPFTGYAVQVVNSKGERRTIIGPATILLEYDETLERLRLSKGIPKDPEKTLETVYLKYNSNAVSDKFTISTEDQVPLEIKLVFLVRFELVDSDKWFAVTNYVQYMVDHIRAIVGNAIRQRQIGGSDEFFQTAHTFIRNLILGPKTESRPRPLRHFEENGMTIYDVQVQEIKILDGQVAQSLTTGWREELKNRLEVSHQTRLLALTKILEQTKREITNEESATRLHVNDQKDAESKRADAIQQASIARKSEIQEAEQAMAMMKKNHEKAVTDISNAILTASNEVELERASAQLEQTMQQMEAEAEAIAKKFAAISPDFIAAISAVAYSGTLKEIAPHLAPLAVLRNESLTGVLKQLTAGTGLEKTLDNLQNLAVRVEKASS